MVTNVPRLTWTDRHGRPYERRADVEQEILQALALSPLQWHSMAAALSHSGNRLSSEALVFLIRSVRNHDRNLAGRLIEVFNLRAIYEAKKWCRGFDPVTTEQILVTVEIKVIGLLLASSPTRQSEFLEVAFAMAVKRHTLREVEKYEDRTVVPASALSIGMDEEDVDRAEVQVPDEALTPERLLSSLSAPEHRDECLRRAYAAISDPRHRKAVRLHYEYGWPLSSKNPSKPSLERLFNKSSRRIQDWIKAALKEMRDALEEYHD